MNMLFHIHSVVLARKYGMDTSMPMRKRNELWKIVSILVRLTRHKHIFEMGETKEALDIDIGFGVSHDAVTPQLPLYEG